VLIPKTIGPPGQSYGQRYDVMQMRYSCQLGYRQFTLVRLCQKAVFADALFFLMRAV